MKLGWLVLASLVVIGCERRGPAPGADPAVSLGHERGACRPEQSCEPGLRCLSDRCVRLPGADCRVVGNQIASIELGNYAPVEARAPTVARYVAACAAGHVTRDEGACLAKTTDLWSAAQCAPRMFPDRKDGLAGACDAVAGRLRSALAAQLGGGDPQAQQMLGKVVTAIQQSCEQDAWPPALTQCVLDSNGTTDGLQGCSAHLSPALQQALSDRLSQAARP